MRYIHPFYIGTLNVILLVIAFILNIYHFNFSVLTILGVLFMLSMLCLEKISHKEHKQAHTSAEKVTKFAKTGIYEKIRHPIYLGWVLFNIGAFLFIESLASLVISLVFIFFWYLEAKQEERFMENKFKEYKKYKEKTGMFFPRGS